jgi:hypothetical protein
MFHCNKVRGTNVDVNGNKFMLFMHEFVISLTSVSQPLTEKKWFFLKIYFSVDLIQKFN